MESEEIEAALATRTRSTLQAENLEAKGRQYTDLGNNAADDHARNHYQRIAQHAKREAQLHREVARAAENRLRLAGVAL